MSLVTGSLVPLLKIKIKARVDDYTDQFNRILMVKLSLIACIILGLHWFKDTLTCIIPGEGGIDGGFVHQACWIQGLYIYDDRDTWNVEGSRLRYYGIPKQLEYDGTRNNDLCKTDDDDSSCVPMKKIFYLQYQWFPFYLGAIALLYYVPYIFFRFVNGDMISLKVVINAAEVDVDAICHNYMNYQKNPRYRMTLRLIGNVFCKAFYCLVNIIALIGTDGLLNGAFRSLGTEMVKWSSSGNSEMLDYTASRIRFRAGDRLLPSYGICEVLELAQDIKHSLYNRHKFVCEISQNVLYQYTLMFLWFCLIIGFIISVVGFLRAIIEQFCPMAFSSHSDETKVVAREVNLTLRECQYLEYIGKTKFVIYKELLKILRDQRGSKEDTMYVR